jgi:hypothetical protein
MSLKEANMEYYKEVIDELAKDIKDQLAGSSLFGEKLDMSDLNTMIVATKFYYEQYLTSKWGLAKGKE